MLRLYLYARVRTSRALLHTRPRVQQAPGIPCALFFGRNDLQSPGEARRGKVKVCPTVIAGDGFSMAVDRSRRNASSDIRPIIGDAPSRHSEECRQHQSRHEQNHRGKMAHALASQPALHSIPENEHGLPSRKMQPG